MAHFGVCEEKSDVLVAPSRNSSSLNPTLLPYTGVKRLINTDVKREITRVSFAQPEEESDPYDGISDQDRGDSGCSPTSPPTDNVPPSVKGRVRCTQPSSLESEQSTRAGRSASMTSVEYSNTPFIS